LLHGRAPRRVEAVESGRPDASKTAAGALGVTVRAIVSLAPTNNAGHVPGDAAFMTILPASDGDVSGSVAGSPARATRCGAKSFSSNSLASASSCGAAGRRAAADLLRSPPTPL
jgi:hypothetical protein